MIRLTVRSRRDGRLAARVIERHGELWVADWGDPSVVIDVSRRILTGGFEVSWDGVQQVAVPGSAAMLRHLALHYATHGWLVFAEDPERRPDQPHTEVEDRDETELVPGTRLALLPTIQPDMEEQTTEETRMPREF